MVEEKGAYFDVEMDEFSILWIQLFIQWIVMAKRTKKKQGRKKEQIEPHSGEDSIFY